MKHSSRIKSVWHSSTSMIFWGVLALTIFGWFTAILEPIFTVLHSIFNIAAQANDGTIPVYNNDSFSTFLKVYENVATSMRIFEVMTIAGWVIYVIGLIQFKNAQVTQRGLRLSESLNTACWLGLSGIFCSFIAGFIGLFGLLFRFISWVLMLISLFKFRSTFGRLSWEKSWNKKARNGALNLRTSYTLAIVLEFFPMICGVIIFFTAFGAIGHSASIVRDFMDNGLGALATYLTGSIAFIVILILAGLTLWICKIIRLFSGWNKIKNGFIRKEILAGHQPKTDAMVVEEDENDGEDEEESVIIARPESDADEDNDDLEEEEFTDNNRNLIIGGSIAGAVLIIALILWFCRDGNVNNKNIENDSIPLTEIKFSDENEVSEHSASSDIIEQEPQSENIVAEELQTDDTSTSDTGVPVYKGSIGGKYAIVMTLIQDGSKFTGEYRYIKKDTPIQLRGEFTDGYEHLVLEEYQGMDMTGKFEGILANDMYDGTWTSADGTRRYPFTVVKHYRH